MGHIRTTNPTNWAVRLFNAQTMPPAIAWALIEPVRIALQRLIDGVGNFDDLVMVTQHLNVASFRANGYFKDKADAIEILEAGGMACHQVAEAGEASGSFMFSLEQRDAACAAVNLFDMIARRSSPAQWQACERELYLFLKEAAAA
jgi:hypothetical protein